MAGKKGKRRAGKKTNTSPTKESSNADKEKVVEVEEEVPENQKDVESDAQKDVGSQDTGDKDEVVELNEKDANKETGDAGTLPEQGEGPAGTPPSARSTPTKVCRRRGKGMQTILWTDEMLDKLITKWQETEFLYDRTHRNFFNTRLKAEAVTLMAEDLSVPGELTSMYTMLAVVVQHNLV